MRISFVLGGDHMSPGELIYFSTIGFVVIFASIGLWFIFRKRKNIAITLTGILVIGYIGYILYYPTLKMNTHLEAYEKVSEYLETKYPDKAFTIAPKHYEKGITVGNFDVNENETSRMGVTLRVDKEGQVIQIGTWSNLEYPTQEDLWQVIEFTYGEPYSLDKKRIDIIKKDEWIDGELTAFALTIDDLPAIALFNYSKAGYGLLELQEGERGGYVIIEKEGYVFIYADERYQGKTVSANLVNRKEFTFNVDQQKGQLIIEKQQ